MDANIRTQIILAAINATPAYDEGLTNRKGEEVANAHERWEAEVAHKARSIFGMVGEKSRIGRSLAVMESAGDPQDKNAKVFAGSVLNITREERSTRGLVTFRTAVSKFSPDGIETARTDRTDTAEGLIMANRFRGLLGHRVLVFIEMEAINDGATKVRTIRHVEDLGVDPAAMTEIQAGKSA